MRTILNDWDREIFTSETWEKARNDKRIAKKIGKDTLEIYPNISYLTTETKMAIAEYIYQIDCYRHVLAKFAASNNWKNRITKLKRDIDKEKYLGLANMSKKSIMRNSQRLIMKQEKITLESRKTLKVPSDINKNHKVSPSVMLTEIEDLPEQKQVTQTTCRSMSEDSFEYPCIEDTIRYDKSYTIGYLFKQDLNDLIKQAKSIQSEFYYLKKAPKKKTAFQKLAPTKAPVVEEEIDEEEKEELELIEKMEKMQWNINLKSIMPEDLRLTCKKKPEFWRALAYLVVQRGKSGIRYDNTD